MTDQVTAWALAAARADRCQRIRQRHRVLQRPPAVNVAAGGYGRPGRSSSRRAGQAGDGSAEHEREAGADRGHEWSAQIPSQGGGQTALRIFEEVQSGDAEHVRAKLAALGRGH